MIDYNKTILYQIYNEINDDVYYGITTNKNTSQRLAYYKSYYKNKERNKMKDIMIIKLFNEFDKIGVDNMKIKAIEYLEFNDKYSINKYLLNFIKDKQCLNK